MLTKWMEKGSSARRKRGGTNLRTQSKESLNNYLRNIAGALLYSTRNHHNLILKSLGIADIDIIKATFGSTKFHNIKFTNILWQEIVTNGADFKNISYSNSKIVGWDDVFSKLNIKVIYCKIERMAFRGTECNINASPLDVRESRFEESTLEVTGNDQWIDCSFVDSNLVLVSGGQSSSVQFTECEFVSSYVSAFISFDRYRRSKGHGRSSIELGDRDLDIVIKDSRFSNCTLLGVVISFESYKNMNIDNCSGYIIVDEPKIELQKRFNTIGWVEEESGLVIIDGNSLLLPGRLKQIAKKIERQFGEIYSVELYWLHDELIRIEEERRNRRTKDSEEDIRAAIEGR